jgi:septum formation protein
MNHARRRAPSSQRQGDYTVPAAGLNIEKFQKYSQIFALEADFFPKKWLHFCGFCLQYLPMETPKEVQFILASASPRRQDLLRQAGYHFAVEPSCIDERAFEQNASDSQQLSKQLALAKALEVARRYPEQVVVGADTVVDADGRIIGKPDDAAHAEQITRLLFNRPHKVITGVAVVCRAKDVQIVEADISTIYPRQLTEQQIAAHIASGNWQGKAGAYGIQESGDEFILRVDGSYTNVMGLPIERIKQILSSMGIRPY